MCDTAIIGGTGMERLPPEFRVEQISVSTKVGRVPVLKALAPDGMEIIFLSRHGEEHTLSPHEIDYRANIAALVELGVRRILATNAVGSLRTDLPAGSLVLLDDFIDFTRSRQLSYWDSTINPATQVTHTDFTTPYCSELRKILLDIAAEQDIELAPDGTYVCADGPRFESPAEIRMFAHFGGDVIGMTGLPEAVFAREAGICYAAVCVVTNLGAGLSAGGIAHDAVVKSMGENIERLRSLLLATTARIPHDRRCTCCASRS
jgi:5'-methylthioadenosine phosphorylase